MKAKTPKLILGLIIIMFLIFIPVDLNDNFSTGSSESVDSKIAGSYILSYIHINDLSSNNWSYTADTFAWCSGNGSFIDPYVIQDCVVNAATSPTGSGILIENSKSAYFVVKNCSAFNADGDSSTIYAGIKLENTNNGSIKNCTVYNNYLSGIILKYCTNNTITNNTIIDNQNGIYLFTSVSNFITCNTIVDNNNEGLIMVAPDTGDTIGNTIVDNVIDNNHNGIHTSIYCNYNLILNNTLNGNDYGIDLQSSHNIIAGNIVNNTFNYGIFLRSSENNVINNVMIGNKIGIHVSLCLNNFVANNTIENSTLNGIRMSGGDGNVVLNNRIKYSNDTGIRLLHKSDNNEILNNVITNSTFYCIYVEADCSNNTFEGNSCLPTYEPVNNGQFIEGFPIYFIIIIITLTSTVFFWKKKKF